MSEEKVKLSARLKVKADDWQRSQPVAGFIYGVIKKYGDDRGAQLGALCTYYGFFSLFPLLMAAYTVLGFVLAGNDELRERVGDTLSKQLPISIDASTISGSGITLALGLILALWSGLGATQVAQDAMATVWDAPRARRPSFVMKKANGLLTLGVVGLSVMVASGASSVIGLLPAAVELLAYPLAVVINAGVVAGLFRVLTPRKLTWKEIWPGACFGGLAWTLLHAVGGAYTHRLIENSNKTYGVFATVIGLLSWIFLLSQAFIYAAEISTVKSRGLYPRALDPTRPTAADETVDRAAREAASTLIAD